MMAITDLRWNDSGELVMHREGFGWELVPKDWDEATPPKPPPPKDVGMFDQVEGAALESIELIDGDRLGACQERFSVALGALLLVAGMWGYQVRMGDVFRDPRAFGKIGEKGPYGSRNSNHKRKLAADLNLFLNGNFLDATEDHRRLGHWWESLGQSAGIPLRWGGRFEDGNHYEYARGWSREPFPR